MAPTFQSVFGSGWHDLPGALQQRYANRPFTHDVVTIEGHLTIEMSWLMRLFTPILYLTRTLVPWHGENTPVTVRFRSLPLRAHVSLPGQAALALQLDASPEGGRRSGRDHAGRHRLAGPLQR